MAHITVLSANRDDTGISALCDRCLTLLVHVLTNFGDGTQCGSLDIPHSCLEAHTDKKSVTTRSQCVLCIKARYLFDAARESKRLHEDVRSTPPSQWILHWRQQDGPKKHDTCIAAKIGIRAQHRIASYYHDIGGFSILPDLVQTVRYWTQSGEPYFQEENAGDYPIIGSLRTASPEFGSMLSSGPSHPNCGRIFDGHSESVKSWFPDRLVQVDSAIDPKDLTIHTIHARLAIKSKPLDFSHHQLVSGVDYLSLSHCWGVPSDPEASLGGREETVLTESKLTAWCEEIPIHALPPTFREAVRLYALIGFRYIWIDSLCIVQDSLEDWQRQSAVMGDVYKHSWLNIAALSSSSDFEGFVKDRDTRVDFGFRTSFRELLGRTQLLHHSQHHNYMLMQGEVKLLWSDSADVPRASSLNAPLFTRAWVFQERNLSRRTLAFTSTAVRFACDGFTKCEQPTWCTARLSQGELRSTLRGIRKIASSIQIELGNEPHGDPTLLELQLIQSLRQKFDQCWRSIVAEFSGCALTKHTDKLIAFGSIANELEASAIVMRKVRYLAGLWETNLPSQMAWYVTTRRSTSPRYKLGEAGHVAPSWSWASVEDPVRAASIFPGNISSIALAEVTLADVQLTTNFVYGSVKTGWLRMKGHLRPISGSFLRTRSTLSLVDQQTAAHFYFIEDTAEAYAMCQRAKNILWLPLTLTYSHDARSAVGDSFSCHGLVLASLTDNPPHDGFIRPSDRVFYRLGIANFGRTFSHLPEDKLLMSLGFWPDQESGAEVWKRFRPSRDCFQEFVIV